MSSAIFRILTGVHAGAEIELAEGTWIFGRDDSADVILADKGIAPRHAAFTVDSHGVVRVEALDGTVTPALGEANATIGTRDASGTILRAGELLRLGTVLFTWGAPEAPDAFWEGVGRELKTHFERLDRAVAPQKGEKTAAGETSRGIVADESVGSSSSPETIDGSEAEDAVAEGRTTSAERASGSKTAEILAGVVLLILFLAAVVLANDAWRARAVGLLEAISPEGAAAVEQFASGGRSEAEVEASRLARVETLLREDKLTEVRAEQQGRVLRFTGSVADDAARGRLLALARTLDVPAVLDVMVESDRVEPLRAAFSTLGFHPEVRIVTEATGVKNNDRNKEQGEVLRVSGYMLSGAVEEKAFLEALNLVPALSGATSPRIERRIRHRADVEPLIRKALDERALKDVEVDYFPGSIRLRAILTPERADALKGALDAVRAACDVPLLIEIANETPVERSNAKPAMPETPAKPAKAVSTKSAASGRTDFKVTSVSSGAIPFVTLATGERVFAGGRLPGGYTLETIRSDRLVLSKNGRRTEYRLELGQAATDRKTGNNH